MSKILVTGGAGMIGSTLVKRLVALDHEVIVVDNLWRGKLEYLHDLAGKPVIDLRRSFFNRDLTVMDICDDILDGVDYVYHLADVVAGIEYVFGNQGKIFRQNMLINSNVINSVRRHPQIKGFVYAGTACSFPASLQSGIDARPLKEEDQYPAAPESAYGWSKLMGEYEANLLEVETKIPVSVLILHNVYGVPCDFGEDKSQVIPALIRKAIFSPAASFVVFGSGRQGRAFVHVDDVVEALLLTLGKGLGKGAIQIGPDVCTSIKDIVEIIVKISGKNIDIHYDISRPEGDKGRRADYSKAKKILGWEPRVSLEDGLRRLYRWIESEIEREGKSGVSISLSGEF
jgi:nucleoside-diphosphate-sugar epimerase